MVKKEIVRIENDLRQRSATQILDNRSEQRDESESKR